MEYDIYGIENPIMDMIFEADKEEIRKHSILPDTCNLISAEQLSEIDKAFAHKEKKLVPGGAVTNSVVLFRQLGGKAFFCGKVGKDEFGKLYKQSLDKLGIDNNFALSDLMTGRALTIITPDKERTFALHLGASLTLSPEDIDVEALKKSTYFFISGYILEDPKLRHAAEFALRIAKEHNVKIAIDVADPALITRCKDDLLKILTQYADIIFANEDEAYALTGIKDPHKALDKIYEMCDIAIVKIGKEGSLVKADDTVTRIGCLKANAVDTTGAGDAYAGAFLYALSKGKDARYAGELGAYCAAKVVECIGARLSEIPEISHFEDHHLKDVIIKK